MRIFFFLAATTSSFVVDSAHSGVPRTNCYEPDTSYSDSRGASLASKTVADVDRCQDWCSVVRGCSHFTFYTFTRVCYLKQGSTAHRKLSAVSGPAHCPPGAEVDGDMLEDCLYVILALTTTILISLGALAMFRFYKKKDDKEIKMKALPTMAFVNPIVVEEK